MIGGADAGAPENETAGREVGAGNHLHQLIDADGGIVEIGDAGVDHLAEIVRRDVGGHADGDAAGAVDEQVGKFRRQHHRLFLAAVVIRLEIDGVVLEVVEQRHGGARQPDLGIALGGGRIAVDGAEIALPVDKGQAHREYLRQAD